ncbi:MAG: aminoacyl-tRNA hydrolase [Patescibacteria group bacterium]|jgi:PTH1 family peptidyl-tRNA hydrolase
MKLIVGLGNPGKKYESTWHNLGWLAVENFRQLTDLPKLKKSTKFQAEISAGEINGEKAVLARPLTYMNNSGISVSALAKFYKIKIEDIIVIHDDKDLALGRLRLSQDSSAGGHNGVKSIIERLGGQKFLRVRLGVKTPLLDRVSTADYVLMKWAKDEKTAVKEQTKKAATATLSILTDGLTKAMNQYN